MPARRRFLGDEGGTGYEDVVSRLPLPAAPATPMAGTDVGPSPTAGRDFFEMMATRGPERDERGGLPPPTGTPPPSPPPSAGPIDLAPGAAPPSGAAPPPGEYTKRPTLLPDTAGGPATSGPVDQYLLSLIQSGVDPQEAARRANQAYGLTFGSEAVYYPASVHGTPTIGLPGSYLSFDNGAWHIVPRAGERGGGSFPAGRTLGGFQPFNVTLGTDPLSQTINRGLSSLVEGHGMTPEQRSVYATLADLIRRSGGLPSDDPLVRAQTESAREAQARTFRTQLEEARGELAGRGLLGLPGAPQGEEGGAISRITERTAPIFSGAVRDIHAQAIQRQNDRLTGALSTITGLTRDAASNMLNALGQGTQRQLGLADIALRTLDQNRQWNQFLADFGLRRDQILYSIQQGRADSLIPLLALFQQFFQTAGQGAI